MPAARKYIVGYWKKVDGIRFWVNGHYMTPNLEPRSNDPARVKINNVHRRMIRYVLAKRNWSMKGLLFEIGYYSNSAIMHRILDGRQKTLAIDSVRRLEEVYRETNRKYR